MYTFASYARERCFPGSHRSPVYSADPRSLLHPLPKRADSSAGVKPASNGVSIFSLEEAPTLSTLYPGEALEL